MAKLSLNNGPTQAPGQSSAKLATPPEGTASIPGQEELAQQQRADKHKRAERQANSVFGSTDPQADYGPEYGYRRIRFHKNDEINPYADEQDKRYGMDERTSKLIMLGVIVAIVFFLTCILPTQVFSMFRVDRTIGTLAHETATAFQAFIAFFTNPNTMFGTHVFTVLVTLLAGAAMGLSGGVFQGAMKNALASPSTLGVTNGGQIGAIIFAVFIAPNSVSATYEGQILDFAEYVDNLDLPTYIMELYGMFFSSLIGCVIVVFLVMLIALIAGRGKVSNASLIIAGQVFAAAIGVFVGWIRNYLTLYGSDAAIRTLTNAQSSTFTGSYNVVSVATFAIPLLACMAAIIAMSGRLTLLAFNDDEARSMGISTTRTRNVMVALCTVMTALVVSFCGVVGFVGFLVPHIARKFIGPDFRYLLPACSLLGAIMVCVTFYVSELGIPGLVTGSAGMITSVIGCLAFIVMAVRNRGAASGEWI